MKAYTISNDILYSSLTLEFYQIRVAFQYSRKCCPCSNNFQKTYCGHYDHLYCDVTIATSAHQIMPISIKSAPGY